MKLKKILMQMLVFLLCGSLWSGSASLLVHAENHETDDQTVDFIPEGYYENIEQYLIDKN